MIPLIQETTVQSIPELAMSLHLVGTTRMASLATDNSTLVNSSSARNNMDSSNTASLDTPEARIRETIPCLAEM